MHTTWSVIIAIVSAACFAVAVVFQQEAAAETARANTSEKHSVLGVAAGVLRRPIWLLATVVDFLGFLLQATALHFGQISVVQPILVLVLAFGMLLGAWRTHTPLGKPDVVGVIALSAGLVGFLAAARPIGGQDLPLPGRLPLVIVSVLGLLGLCIVISRPFGPRGRAATLSLGAGISFAVVAALAKTIGAQLTDHGPLYVLAHWQVYSLAVVALSGLTVEQSAFAAGPLAPSLAVLTLMDPMASLCAGPLVYGESLDGAITSMAAASFCGLLIVLGVVLVARSRVTAAVQGSHGEPAAGSAPGAVLPSSA